MENPGPTPGIKLSSTVLESEIFTVSSWELFQLIYILFTRMVEPQLLLMPEPVKQAV